MNQCQNYIHLITILYIIAVTVRFPYQYNIFSLKMKMNRALSEMCVCSWAVAGKRKIRVQAKRAIKSWKNRTKRKRGKKVKEWKEERKKGRTNEKNNVSKTIGDENADISSHGLFQCSSESFRIQYNAPLTWVLNFRSNSGNRMMRAHILLCHMRLYMT